MTFLNELTKRVCELEKTSDMIIHHIFQVLKISPTSARSAIPRAISFYLCPQ